MLDDVSSETCFVNIRCKNNFKHIVWILKALNVIIINNYYAKSDLRSCNFFPGIKSAIFMPGKL